MLRCGYFSSKHLYICEEIVSNWEMYVSVLHFQFNTIVIRKWTMFDLVKSFHLSRKMRLKEIQRTAHQAWSPAGHHPMYLALGTSAQQLDASFNTTAALEIFEVDFSDPSLEMQLRGTLPTTNRWFIEYIYEYFSVLQRWTFSYSTLVGTGGALPTSVSATRHF